MKHTDIYPGKRVAVVLRGALRSKEWVQATVEYLSGPLTCAKGGITWVVLTDCGLWLHLPARKLHRIGALNTRPTISVCQP